MRVLIRSMPGGLVRSLFLLIAAGGLLFAIDQPLAGGAGAPRTIVVGSEVNIDAVEAFEESQGRDPNEEELGTLHRVWIDNEVLYREGLARQLDQGDDQGEDATRERVISRMLSVIDASIELPPIDDKLLRDWFEEQRARYDEPARYGFREAVLSGDSSESAVRAFAIALNAGTSSDSQAGVRVFQNRPHANIVQSYGSELAKAFQESTTGEWRALRTRDGWRAMRLDSITPAKLVVYDTLRNAVLQDWKVAMTSARRDAAVRTLASSYKIIYEPAAHHH